MRWLDPGTAALPASGSAMGTGRYLKRLDQSYCDILPLLLNHQSSCHLLLWEGDATGTQPVVNRQAEISTPYGWLSPSTDAEHFLSPSVNLLELY